MLRLLVVVVAAVFVLAVVVKVAELLGLLWAVNRALRGVRSLRADYRARRRYTAAREALSAQSRPVGYTGVNNPGEPAWYDRGRP